MRNKKSIILLAIFVSLALFLGGFRLGRKVEVINKTYIPPTITIPTASPEPTPTTPTTTFKTYIHPTCGISFLYPDTLVQTKNSSESGTIEKDKSLIHFTCPSKIASQSAILLTPTITTINGLKITSYASTSNIDTWFVVIKAKKITFNTSQNLTDLIKRTVSFIK